ncbi:MAG: hypothetical protein JKY81_08435 [Colwellia sp.]|nr:hypothetical protein [Colwellia sp.]
MTTTLLLQVLFSDIKKTTFFRLNKFIKQLSPLLFLLFSLNTLFSASAIAEQKTFFNQTAQITSLLQDKKDFIWLSGQNGLYRFDGMKTILFSNKEEGWSIPFTWIHNISEKENHLLISTETSGLWLFDTTTGKTQRININAATNTFYRALHHKNSYYVISMGPQHLYRYDITTGKTALIAKNINNNHLFASENRVYFNNNNELYFLDTSQNSNKVQKNDAVSEKIIAATSIKNTVIIASEKHLFSINDNGKMIQKSIISPITAITPHNNQNAIFSVNLLGKITKRELTTLNELDNNFPNVAKIKYQLLLHDNSGVLWLSNNKKIQQLAEAKVKNHLAIFDTKFNAIETEVYQDELYLGSYGEGLHTFSSLTKQKLLSIANINHKLSSKAKKINDLLAIEQELFMATFDGLWRYNKNSAQIQKVNLFFEDDNLSDLILLKIRRKKNLLYIAADGQGLIIYDLNKKNVIQHLSKSTGLSSGEVIDVLPLANGDIWLATATGVDIVNGQTARNIVKQSSSKFISLLLADDKVFVSTKGDGIQAYNRQGNLLAHFAKGINFNYMSLIDGRIFASAKPGLYKINPANYQFSMMPNTSDFSFTDNALLFNDSLHIANSTGILHLPRIAAPTFHPKVYISKTTVSGNSYLLNKAIQVNSGNDVITLDLASLDYRPGITKQYQYTLNSNKWHQINGNQLTLTGLASGDYHIEIMATNSLGQWSKYKAFTEINVAFPWYWTPQIRLVYGVSLFGIFFLTAWLLYLRSKSISHIHGILQSDINNYGKTSMQVKRNLTVALALINEHDIKKGKLLLQRCVDDLNEQQKSSEPNSLNGNSLTEAVPFLAEYLHNKYQVKLSYQFELKGNELDYELQADLYRVIFEAITSAILNGSGRSFKVVLQKFKSKIWLNISDDSQSFIHFNSKINFDISMYYIRQIVSKHNGSINTFNEQGNASQLVLSLPVLHRN